jgi:hypothetical protein
VYRETWPTPSPFSDGRSSTTFSTPCHHSGHRAESEIASHTGSIGASMHHVVRNLYRVT